MEIDKRVTEVPKQKDLSLRKPWQAPAVEVLLISETQSHTVVTPDAALGHSS